GSCADDKIVPLLRDSSHTRFQFYHYTDLLEFLHQPGDEVGIERGEHALHLLKDNDVCSRAGGDMSELPGNVPPAKHHDVFCQTIQLEELSAGDHMLLALNTEPHRRGPHR